jgi:hypothetical protein
MHDTPPAVVVEFALYIILPLYTVLAIVGLVILRRRL